MKKKYYLRGLGIGILITALLFVVALVFYKPTLSDSEIRHQARSLGMIDAAEAQEEESRQGDKAEDEASQEDQVTEEVTENEDGSTTTTTTQELSGDEVEKAPDERVKTPVTPDSESEDAGSSETASSGSRDNSGSSSSEGSTSNNSSSGNSREDEPASEATGEKVSFTIVGGQNSGQVAAALASKGLVDNGRSFDVFLESNGYDRVIRPGDYNIPQGASYEQIARIITGR